MKSCQSFPQRSQSLGRREYLGLLAHVHDIFIATRRALDITVGVSAILPWCGEVTAKLLLTAITRAPGRATAIVKRTDEFPVLQVEAFAAASAVEPISGIGRIPLNHVSARGARGYPHGLLVVLMTVVEVGACYVIIMAAFCTFPRLIISREAWLVIQLSVAAIAIPLIISSPQG